VGGVFEQLFQETKAMRNVFALMLLVGAMSLAGCAEQKKPAATPAPPATTPATPADAPAEKPADAPAK
jgi:hypothetical protein